MIFLLRYLKYFREDFMRVCGCLVESDCTMSFASAVRRPFSRAEREWCPIANVVPSACNFVLATVQAVIGVVEAALFALLTALTCGCCDWFKEKTTVGMAHIQIGVGGMLSSFLNIATLGFLFTCAANCKRRGAGYQPAGFHQHLN